MPKYAVTMFLQDKTEIDAPDAEQALSTVLDTDFGFDITRNEPEFRVVEVESKTLVGTHRYEVQMYKNRDNSNTHDSTKTIVRAASVVDAAIRAEADAQTGYRVYSVNRIWD